MTVSAIDIGIIVVYLLAMMGIGLFVGRGNETQEDYFVAGRSMPWFPVALSVAATAVSANAFIGNPGYVYTDGFTPYMQNVTIPLACFIAMVVVVPIFFHLRVSSIYEYMELRLGGYSRNLAVAQFFINSLIQASSMVYVPALIIQRMTGLELGVIVPLIVIFAIMYTVLGGIKAVIWTDTVQMIVLWGGIVAIIYYAVTSTGLGLTETVALADAKGLYDSFLFSTDPSVTYSFMAGLFGIFMWTRYFCFDQAQVQRVLTSKSMSGVKRSFLVSTIIINVVILIMLFVGSLLYIFFDGRQFDAANDVMISFILEELPVGVLGIIISAIFAAAMSSVDSLLNSMTTVFTKDIYEKYFAKDKEAETSLKQTIAISIVLGIFVIIIVILGFNGTVKSVIDVVGTYISYFSGPALGAFCLAMFTKKANDKGTASGFAIGFILGFIIAKTFSISWLINPAIGSTITFISGYLLSGVFKSDKTIEQITPYTAAGLRQQMIAEKVEKELMPYTLDKYSIGVLVFFVLQLLLLVVIR